MVQGRLVAMPYHANVGILFFRTDLLRQYGYRGPPSTWQELEGMAAAIQKGERAKGDDDFWGYVWQGAWSRTRARLPPPTPDRGSACPAPPAGQTIGTP